MTGQLGPNVQRRRAKFQSILPMYDVVFLPMRLDNNIISNSCSYSSSCRGGRGEGGEDGVAEIQESKEATGLLTRGLGELANE